MELLWPLTLYLTLPLVRALSLLLPSLVAVQRRFLVKTPLQRNGTSVNGWTLHVSSRLGILTANPTFTYSPEFYPVCFNRPYAGRFTHYYFCSNHRLLCHGTHWQSTTITPYSPEFLLCLLLLPYLSYTTLHSSHLSDWSSLQRPSPNLPTTTEFFMNTTLSKTAQGIELLATSILILEVLKDVELSESFQEHNAKLELLATLVASTFSPAEA